MKKDQNIINQNNMENQNITEDHIIKDHNNGVNKKMLNFFKSEIKTKCKMKKKLIVLLQEDILDLRKFIPRKVVKNQINMFTIKRVENLVNLMKSTSLRTNTNLMTNMDQTMRKLNYSTKILILMMKNMTMKNMTMKNMTMKNMTMKNMMMKNMTIKTIMKWKIGKADILNREGSMSLNA